MKSKWFIWLLVSFLFYGKIDAIQAQVQIRAKVDSISISEPQSVSIDQQNNIYFADKKGAIKKYNLQNKLVAEFSPQKSGQATLIEAWNPLRIFVFYENFQEYQFLDRFMTTSNRFEVRNITSFAKLMTPSADNNLWLIDQADFSLKKYNISFGQFTIKTSFDLLLQRNNYDITFMREYQNRVFVADKQAGILVFDNLGNYLLTLPYKGVEYFNFYSNEIYFIHESKVVFIDIYSQKQTHSKPLNNNPKYILYADGHIWFFYSNWIKTFHTPQIK